MSQNNTYLSPSQRHWSRQNRESDFSGGINFPRKVNHGLHRVSERQKGFVQHFAKLIGKQHLPDVPGAGTLKTRWNVMRESI